MATLEFRDITLAYPSADEPAKQVIALRDLSLSVEEGESVAIIGPSGCGKSSLLRLACGLLRPTSGSVLVDGAPIERPRRDVALILQDFGLLPWRNVLANAELGLKVRRCPASERRMRARRALTQVGLSGFERSYPSELSGGMQQRLALARALALDVRKLLMDEPLSALDALSRERIQNLLRDLWREQGYTQVLVTHSIEEAVFLGQRIVMMSARPGHVRATIANPDAGSDGYRLSNAFHVVCDSVREALGEATEAASTEAAAEAIGALGATDAEASHV